MASQWRLGLVGLSKRHAPQVSPPRRNGLRCDVTTGRCTGILKNFMLWYVQLCEILTLGHDQRLSPVAELYLRT